MTTPDGTTHQYDIDDLHEKNPIVAASIEVICETVLSRLVESVRFHISQEMLETPFTFEAFQSITNESHNLDMEQARKLVDRVTTFSPKLLDRTFQDLLDFENSCFPESTTEQRETLKEIALKRTVVFKEEVECRLCLDSDSQLITFLFGSGAEAIPGEIFQDIVACLDAHPRSLGFGNELSSQMVSTGRRMVSLIPYLVLLFVMLIQIPKIANVQHLDAMQTTLHFLEADWKAGCPFGTTDVKGCHFIKRSLNEIETVEFDVLRFVREELILRIWNSPDHTPAEGPLGYHNFTTVGPIGSTIPYGALIIRLVDTLPLPGKDNPKIPNPYSCEDQNLTVLVRETRTGAVFPCSAIWSTAIPFNTSQADALERASGATADLQIQKDAALIAQFASYQPSTGFYIYTTISLTLPLGGGVLVRPEIRISDTKTHERVLPILIVNAIVVATSIGFGAFYAFHGKKFMRVDLVCDVALLCVVAACYGVFKSLHFPDATYQVEDVPQDADYLANMYFRAQVGLSLYYLFTIALSARYLREVGGLYIVIAIIQHAALEIMAMLIIFGIWTLAFSLVAYIMFGPASTEMHSAFTLFVYLFDFFSGGSDYEHLSQIHPVLGPIFWFTFTIFVSFFALNLLIAVLTAPLTDVKESSNLDQEVNTECEAEIATDSRLSWTEKKRFSLVKAFTPFLNIVYDCAPLPRTKLFWVELEQCSTVLFGGSSVLNETQNTVTAGLQLLDILVTDFSLNHPFETPLLKKTNDLEVVDKISFAYTVLAVAGMTRSNAMRDARMNKCLMAYDIFTTDIRTTMNVQRELYEQAKQKSSIDARLSHAGRRRSSYSTTKVEQMNQSEEDLNKSNVVVGNEEQTAFYFTRHVEWHLHLARLRIVNFLLLLATFLFFVTTGYLFNTDSAFLAASLKDGLRDFPIHQECFDENCTEGFTFRKTFMDTGDLFDWYYWVEKVLKRQMFLRGQLTPNATGMMWDRRTHRTSPMYFRQLRAEDVDCKFGDLQPPYNSGQYSELLARRRTTHDCSAHADSGFTKKDMPVPEDLHPLLNASMYKHQDDCIEERKPRHYGFLQTYPCAGYTVEISTEDELDALMNSSWFDRRTRMIAFSSKFASGDAKVELSLILELGEGGGTAYPSAIAVSLSESRETLMNMFVVAMCVLSFDAIVYVGVAIYNLHKYGLKNFRAPDLPFPSGTVFVYFLALVVPNIAYQTPTMNERLKLQLGVATLALTYSATEEVFFPVAGLLSKSATKLFDTLKRAAVQCALVIPFYVVFLLALASSGMIMLATNVPKFSLFRYALVSVLRGALGDWQTDALYRASPEVVEFYNIVFYAVVLIMLANLILAMVTSAANDALINPAPVDLAERVCRARNWHVLYGGMFEFILGWNVWRVRNSSLDAVRHLETLSVGNERLLFLPETVMNSLGPVRANQAFAVLHLDTIAENIYPSTVVFLTQLHADFARRYPVLEAQDRDRETMLLKETVEEQRHEWYAIKRALTPATTHRDGKNGVAKTDTPTLDEL